MGRKTKKRLIEIIDEIDRLATAEGCEFTLRKESNQGNDVYKFSLNRDTEGFILSVFIKIKGVKNLTVNKDEYSSFVEKLELDEEEIKLPKFKSYNIEEILYKLRNIEELEVEELEDTQMSKFTLRDKNEKYRLCVNIYSNGTISFQGNLGSIGEVVHQYLKGTIENLDEILKEERIKREKRLEEKAKKITQKSWLKYLEKAKPTEEQLKVIESEEPLVVVNAVAGSGKTTTLEGIINKRNNQRILYIVYNKKMQEEAKVRFESYKNVKVVTGHSLAYEKFGNETVVSDFNKFEINKALNTHMERTVFTIKVFVNYLSSSSFSVSDYIKENDNRIKSLFFKYMASRVIADINKMVDFKDNQITLEDSNEIEFMNLLEKSKLIDYYRKRYSEMKKILHGNINIIEKMIKQEKIKITHDYYLKSYQLSNEIITKYDIVLLDEAQDTNEVMIDIVENKFGNARKIIVGDTHQGIYRWRGATNAMEYFEGLKGSKQYSLTNSFRIGSETAKVCSKLLSLKGKEVSISGLNINQKKIGTSEDELEKNGKAKTILFRKNSNMIKKAIEYKKKIYFLKNINFDKYYDLIYFKNEELGKIQYLHVLKKYKSYKQLEDYIKEDLEEDSEVRLGVNLLNEYGDKLSSKLEDIKKRQMKNFDSPKEAEKKGAELILGTIHSSKGHEFNKLSIDKDVLDFFYNDRYYEKELDEIIEEINLLYVALTRSSNELVYDIDFVRFNELVHYMVENFELEAVKKKDVVEDIHTKNNLRSLIEQREIKSIFHFTKINPNLKNILKNGIMSLEKLEKVGMKYLESDFERKDKHFNYISTSISFPNNKMLYKKMLEGDRYTILEIDPQVFIDKSCKYSKRNAAIDEGNKIKRLDTCEDLEEIFIRNNSHEDLPKCYPTDVQAEILIKDYIEIDYIKNIYFHSKDYSEQIKKAGKYKHINYKCNDLLFGWRHDYIREVKNG